MTFDKGGQPGSVAVYLHVKWASLRGVHMHAQVKR
jgi:hypothetical protein